MLTLLVLPYTPQLTQMPNCSSLQPVVSAVRCLSVSHSVTEEFYICKILNNIQFILIDDSDLIGLVVASATAERQVLRSIPVGIEESVIVFFIRNSSVAVTNSGFVLDDVKRLARYYKGIKT